MKAELCRDILFLARKARPALQSDSQVADNLRDTLDFYSESCVGMAANMIGENIAVIVFSDNGKTEEMFNPEIVKADLPYKTSEGCLCLEGKRETLRYKKIKVHWQTREGKPMIRTFEGFTAQIIQHECDHLAGKII